MPVSYSPTALISMFVALVTRVLIGILQTLVYLTLFGCLAHSFGWIERIIWFLGEKEASKVANKTKVTIGSFRLENFWSLLLHGRAQLRASNVVLHTPQREEWKWDSPLIARIGSVLVECNVPITLFHLVFFQNPLVPIELYTVVVSDVEVFVERRQHVFNVYLMDPSIVLPNSQDIMVHYNQQQQERQAEKLHKEQQERKEQLEMEATEGTSVGDSYTASASNGSSSNNNNNTDDKEQAQKLVNEMLQAVKSLGQAAQEGSLQGALQQQGQHLAHTLRRKQKELYELQENQQGGKETLEKGVRVMQHVGKVAVESLASAKHLEQLVPERRHTDKPKPIGRVGRVVLRDLRIFTRDTWIDYTNHINADDGTNQDADEQTTYPIQEDQETTASSINGASSTTGAGASIASRKTSTKRANNRIGTDGGWNRPITIQELIVRAAELCPPMSLVDEDDLPAIYQPLDKVAEVVWKRVLAEMAKSNTGRFFHTAMSEVLGYMKTTTAAKSTKPKK